MGDTLFDKAAGQNLQGFVATQLDFANHIRDPGRHPRPSDVEARRMQIYLDLFFNNVNSFVTNTFPVLNSLLSEARWLQLVRDFFARHPSESPYFLQVSEEFLTFLSESPQSDLPGFVLELAHYEWVEMSLDVAQDVTLPEIRPLTGDTQRVLITPYCRRLAYHYPVHKIGPDHQPDEPGADPTYLVVYRNRDELVRFMESSPVTHRILELLEDNTVPVAAEKLAGELVEAGINTDDSTVEQQTRQLIEDLAQRDIVLGGLA